MKKLTQKRLKELLYYNPGTGIFIRLINAGSRSRKGDIAGGPDGDGYRIIYIDGKPIGPHGLPGSIWRVIGRNTKSIIEIDVHLMISGKIYGTHPTCAICKIKRFIKTTNLELPVSLGIKETKDGRRIYRYLTRELTLATSIPSSTLFLSAGTPKLNTAPKLQHNINSLSLHTKTRERVK